MKYLSATQLQKAPPIVQYVYIASFMNQPVGGRTMDDAIEQYPDYFPEEVERMRKWELIPQEVHDNYWKEYGNIDDELFKDVPTSEGLIAWCDNTEKYQIWNKAWNIANEKAKPLREKLHEKYYSKYGIEWNVL